MSNEVFGFTMHIKVVFTLCYSLLSVQLCLFKNVENSILKYFIAKIIALISHASKVMLKILQARLQQYVNRELHVFKLVLEKAKEPEFKLPTSAGS